MITTRLSRSREHLARLPELVFPAVPYRPGRVAALLVALAVLAVVWIPAAWSPQPWRTIPGVLVSAALGIAILCAARLVLRRLWRWAAPADNGEDVLAVLGTVGIGVVGLSGGGQLIATPFSEQSWAWPFLGPAAALWAAHEVALCVRIYHQAQREHSDES